MKVRDVMATHVVTVRSSSTFREVLLALTKHKISGVIVVDKKRKVLGVISEKDLLFSLFPSQEEFYQDIEYFLDHKVEESEICSKIDKLKARDLMSKTIVSVKPDDHILTAGSLLLIHGIRRLPVIDNGKLVGIVTTNNIYKNFLLHLASEKCQ